MMDKKYIYTIILILYIAGLIVGAVLPPKGIMATLGEYDKIVHALEFFFLTILLLNTFTQYRTKGAYIIALVCAFALAFGSEYVQRFVPGRSYSYFDILADLSGIIVGTLVYWGISSQK
jgi:hypothetical protein